MNINIQFWRLKFRHFETTQPVFLLTSLTEIFTNPNIMLSLILIDSKLQPAVCVHSFYHKAETNFQMRIYLLLYDF